MDEAAQAGGARTVRGPQSSPLPDPAAYGLDQGSRMESHPRRLHAGERQQHVAGQRAPDHVRGAPKVAQMADRELGGKFDKYFTQTLLPDYVAERRPAWASRVVFDARGHFAE